MGHFDVLGGLRSEDWRVLDHDAVAGEEDVFGEFACPDLADGLQLVRQNVVQRRDPIVDEFLVNVRHD